MKLVAIKRYAGSINTWRKFVVTRGTDHALLLPGDRNKELAAQEDETLFETLLWRVGGLGEWYILFQAIS
jgi:hypothetical protein